MRPLYSGSWSLLVTFLSSADQTSDRFNPLISYGTMPQKDQCAIDGFLQLHVLDVSIEYQFMGYCFKFVWSGLAPSQLVSVNDVGNK